jgi:sec-independent protein translocase protein TatA
MGISIWQLLIILAIVLVLFGAKRLKNIGSDLGGAIKGFKKAVKDGDKKKDTADTSLEKKETSGDVFDVTAEEKVTKKTTQKKEETK